MRAKLIAFLFACYFLFPVSIGNAEGLIINGYDWKKYDRGEQISFVVGWVKSGSHAADTLVLLINHWDESRLNMNANMESFKKEGVLLQGVTMGQIVDTINELYSDPRVKIMDISDVMPFVSGRLIMGWTVKSLDELIAIEVKLQRCEKEEHLKGEFVEECSSARKEKLSYLQKIRKGN